MKIFKQLLTIVMALFISFTCFSQKKQTLPTALPDALLNGDPSAIKMGGFLGDRMDDCIEKRVKGQDVSHLVKPFYNKTETRAWQSEFLGKWLMGAIISYQYSQDPRLLDSIQSGVKGLLESQSPNGYIGNYSEAAQLQQWDVWGRKYSMLGLLASYDLTGDKKTLDAVRRVADHLMTQVGAGKTNIVATGNYIGMASSSVLEPIVFLYRRTGDSRYLDFAKYIVEQWETSVGPQLISKTIAGVPVGSRFPHSRTLRTEWYGTKNGQKAYEMMSCYEGLLELYKVTQEPSYLSAVEKTVQNIINTEINIAGSGSAYECWYHGKPQQARPTYHTMETCVTMTWMKLCQTLLRLTGNPIYADQIEISAYNALSAAMKDDATEIAMYSPLDGHRHASGGQCGMNINCCNANGPRGFALLSQIALMQHERDVYVNLYTGFEAGVELNKKNKVVISQESNYPAEGKITIRVEPVQPETFTVALRIPAWSKENSVVVNSDSLRRIIPGAYFKINRQWQKGDVITLNLDVRGRVVKEDGHVAILKGPVVLARDTRFADGFTDEAVRIVENNGYVALTPVAVKPAGIRMAFTAPVVLGTMGGRPTQVKFCDFASAGNTWADDVRYRVWLPETLDPTAFSYVDGKSVAAVYKGHELPRLRGAMIQPNGFKPEDLETLAGKWNANHIRWQVIWNGFPNGPADRSTIEEYEAWIDRQIEQLDRMLPELERYGVRLTLDLHTPPGGRMPQAEGSTMRMFTDKKFQDAFVATWQKLAAKYKDVKTIWCYDILNEAVEGKIPGNADVLNWRELALRTSKEIRKIDPVKAIVIEPAPWGGPEALANFAPFDPKEVPNVVYSVHMYIPHNFTHQGVYEQPVGPVYPGVINGKYWDKEQLREALIIPRKYAKDHNVAIYIGEFGSIRWAPDNSTYRYLKDCIEIFEEEGWDWAYHAFREWQGWSVEHGPDKDDARPAARPTDRELLLRSWFEKNKK